ncbi:hemerythrin domain-containing protein [Streptomyces sp. NPDC049040]|uniref:hemerythrin domain-containing protein n=1 Tax=Streptomyces sp. NPDC049040 TaxID=3365593 RepID=UPI00371B3536
MSDFPAVPVSVIETRLVHDSHRRASVLLAEAAARSSVPPAAVAALRDFLVANVRHHHESEDEVLWPMIGAVSPAHAVAMAELTGEHKLLETALDDLAAVDISEGADRALYTCASAILRDLVHRHLDDEEPVLFPALRDYITDDAWREFALHVKTTSPTLNLHFMVGFVDLAGDAGEADLILGGLPTEDLAALRAQARDAFRELEATA